MKSQPKILLIESSTRACSVAIAQGESILSVVNSSVENDHAANITLYIQQALEEADIATGELEAIAVSHGPGSYTGLRIGMSTAKGLCYALDIPLITVSTLQSFANHVLRTKIELNETDLICSLMDARRMEVYAAAFNPSLEIVVQPFAHILTPDSFSELLDSHHIHFVGDGVPKAKQIIRPSSKIRWFDDFMVTSTIMLEPALKKYLSGDFADLAYSEPFYLKEFIAAASKVKGLK